MIDWGNLLANALWIFGCSLALATLSYSSWQAWLFSTKMRTQLAQPGIQRALYLSGVLFCSGLAATSVSSLETSVWVVLGVLFWVGLFLSLRQSDGKDKPALPPVEENE